MIQELHRFQSQAGVSFAQLFLTHMLSLEFVLGFCYGIAKGGDCKIEFNQPLCWLYYVPNLFVIQQLVTLCLGGNHVKVVCESVKKFSRLCSEAGTRGWISRLASHQKMHTSEAYREAEPSCQLQHYRTKSPVWPFSWLATQSSREAKSLVHFVMEKLTLHMPFLLQYKYPLYPRNIESFLREF